MSSSENSDTVKIQSACEYRALKECLEKNNWKKDKCEKEWQEFKTLCSNNKRLIIIIHVGYNVVSNERGSSIVVYIVGCTTTL